MRWKLSWCFWRQQLQMSSVFFLSCRFSASFFHICASVSLTVRSHSLTPATLDLGFIVHSQACVSDSLLSWWFWAQAYVSKGSWSLRDLACAKKQSSHAWCHQIVTHYNQQSFFKGFVLYIQESLFFSPCYESFAVIAALIFTSALFWGSFSCEHERQKVNEEFSAKAGCWSHLH